MRRADGLWDCLLIGVDRKLSEQRQNDVIGPVADIGSHRLGPIVCPSHSPTRRKMLGFKVRGTYATALIHHDPWRCGSMASRGTRAATEGLAHRVARARATHA
jgi:hypothetical protein